VLNNKISLVVTSDNKQASNTGAELAREKLRQELAKEVEKNREEILEALLEKSGETFENFKKRVKDEKLTDPWQLNSEKAIQNKYFETMERLIRLPENYEQLVTPNSSDEMLAVEKKINDKLKLVSDSKAFDYSNLSDLMYLVNERQDYLDLKGPVVGMSATGNTGHIQNQSALVLVGDNGKASEYDRTFLGDFKVYLPHAQLKYKGEMRTTYSGMKNGVGNYISDFISQLINGAVDGVKNKWLIRLIKNKDLLSTSIFLGRCGVSPEYVFTFINQPIIQEYIKQECEKHNVKEIAYDPYNAAALVANLYADGLPVKKVGQGMAMLSNPSKTTEQLILKKAIHHDGNPFVGWQLGNCEVYTDVNGNVKVRKNEADPSAKVDGIIAMIMALHCHLDNVFVSDSFGFRSLEW